MTSTGLAVIPLIVGPMQVLLAMLPAILIGLGTALVALFKPSSIKLFCKLLWRTKGTVLLLVAAVAGALYGLRQVRGRSGPVGHGEHGDTEWPMFRGGMDRHGAQAGTASPSRGGLNWSFTTDAEFIYSSPTPVGNRVYFTSATIGVFADRGAIFCLDADTGGLVWKRVPDGYRATFSSPAVSGKYLVVGEGLHLTKEARIICLDLEQNGKVLWTYRTQSHVESTPAISGDRLVVGAGDDGYYCFRLEPDADGNPVKLWHLEGERFPDAETSPVIHDGRVYLGLGINGHAVVCVDLESGKELWRMETPSPVFTPPSLRAGRLYFGMGHGNFIESEEEVIAKTRQRLVDAGRSPQEADAATAAMKVEGEVWCVDLESHEPLWTFTTDRTVLNAVVAAEDRVYVASRGGTVYALSTDGVLLESWNAKSPIISSPALTDSLLYVVTQAGRLYGLDRATLDPVWEADLGVAAGGVVSSPAIARGRVYVGTPGRGLLCLGSPSAEQGTVDWPAPLGGNGKGGWLDGSPLTDQGALLWRFPPGNAAAPALTAAAAVAGTSMFLPIADGERKGLLHLQRGETLATAPDERWFFPTPLGLTASPVVDAASVYCVDGGPGDAGRKLRCIDRASGQERWSLPVEPDASASLLLDTESLWLQDGANGLRRLDLASQGHERWRAPLGDVVGVPALGEGLAVVATRHPAALWAVDDSTGQVLWKQTLATEPTGGPVLDRRTILIGTLGGVSAHRLLDGTEIWNTPSGDTPGSLVLQGGRLAATIANHTVLLLDPRDGAVLKSLGGAVPGIPPLLTRDALLFASEEGLTLYTFANERQQRWMATAWLGEQTTPMILQDSTVLFATDKRGWICAGRRRQ